MEIVVEECHNRLSYTIRVAEELDFSTYLVSGT